eukprot:TRINITY_DN70898_c0_g1_i1.p2 TRINITY_DN70898_c0_g1~~TRINITY_DN70898_c0_g1_i1.p2  ORF type:complete len:279 (-),score=14.91 TRINITY_DN70898_c0_g1_i1:2364-3152(-)
MVIIQTRQYYLQNTKQNKQMSKAYSSQPQNANSGSDDEFVDAKESWEELELESKLSLKEESKAKPKPTPKSAIAPSRAHLPLPRPVIAKGTLDPPSFWSDPAKSTISPQKPGISKGFSFRSKAVTPFVSKGASTIPSDRTIKESSRLPESLSESLTPVMGVLPLQPVQKPPTPSSSTPKPRNRVPPIAVIKTQKYMKDALEFDNLCLQQELRAGAQSIWVARFSADGAFFGTGGEDHIVRVWEVGDYSQQCTFDCLLPNCSC